jgi:serine/threonine protein phosphatase PrpC
MIPTRQPAEIPAVGEATLGWAFGCSRMGASHRRAGKPCQDAYALWTGSGAGANGLALAVADGHGDDRHDLSHFGSTLAVRAAIEELGALHTCYALEGKWTQLKSSFKADFPRRLGRRWREAVLGEQRRRSDAPGGVSNSEPEEALLIRYGTTLIAALVVGDVLLIGQIGDGGVLLVKEGGEVECPLPNNPLEVGGQTDSLGSVEAPRLWRTAALERTGAGILLLATDGLINAFADDAQWHAFALSLQERIRDFGWPSVASALPGWLDHYSEMASGDDITLAVAVLGPPLAEAREQGISEAAACGQPAAPEALEHEDSCPPSPGPCLDPPVTGGDGEPKLAEKNFEP